MPTVWRDWAAEIGQLFRLSANLAVEPTDYITVPVPIHDNSVMDKGLVERKLTQFGSAVTKQADLINFEVRENHTTSGYYLSLTL